MAFFTFTTVSGSAATNNLVYNVSSAIGGAVTLSLSSTGTLVYTNIQGNSTDTGWTLANLAAKGQPVVTEVNGAVASVPVNVTLQTFQTPTMVVKAKAAFQAIDAATATSAQIDAFIANNTGAAVASLNHATLDVTQFAALRTAALLSAGGAVAIDATDATPAEIASLINGSQAGVVAAGAIDNVDLLYSQYSLAGSATTIGAAYIAAEGASIDFAFEAAIGAGVYAAINPAISKIAAIDNVTINAASLTDLTAFNTFAGAVVDRGIIAVNAGGMGGLTTAQWSALLADRALLEVNSIVNANPTVAQFLAFPNKFAVNGVIATGLDLTGAATADIDSVIVNKAKLVTGAIVNATVSPTEFAGLTTKIAAANATVNALTATTGEVTSIVNNLSLFKAAGLTHLSMDQTQAVVANTNAASFNTAVADGQASITATSAAVINTAAITKTISVTGSEGADNITTGTAASLAANTVQGGKGADIIIGNSAANGGDLLQGGNAADTITGGAGNDTLVGGNSILANVLTGGAGVDRFVTNGGLNTITDLGAGGADVIVNSAGVTTNASVTTNWTATNATSNAGTLNINVTGAASTANGQLIVGGSGVNFTANALVASTIVGTNFNDTLNGSLLNDNLSGGAGVDSIVGGLGSNTFTGDVGFDVFHSNNSVALGNLDQITDLATGDAVIVDVGAAVTALSANFVATNATINNGAATLTGAVYDDLSLASGTNGWTLTSGAAASTIIGSAGNDTITGGAGGSNLQGGAGNDSIVGQNGIADLITGGAGADTMTGGTGAGAAGDVFNYTSVATIAAQTGITLATADTITDFVSGADTIKTGTAGTGANYVEAANAATFAAALAAANAAFAASGVTYYLTGSTADATGLLFVDATPGDGTADAVIKLTGISAANFAATDIVA